MRIRITFKLKNRGKILPFHHQHLFSQMIRGVMVNNGEQFYKDFEIYSFSGLKGLTRVNRQGLQYNSNRVSLVLATPNEDFLNHLLTLIFQRESYVVGELTLVPEYVEKEEMPSFENATKVICISPIVLLKPKFQEEEESKRFISPFNNEFSDILFENIIDKLECSGVKKESIKDYHKFQIVPDNDYLEKIRTQGKKFSRIYTLYNQGLKHEVRGYTFPFTLYAPPEIQEFIFNCGIGFFAHKGFGMIDLANVNPLSRTKHYQLLGAELVNTETYS